MNDFIFSEAEIKFIKEMVSLFVSEHPSIYDVKEDDEGNVYAYDNQGNKVDDNFEISRYKLIQSVESKLKSHRVRKEVDAELFIAEKLFGFESILAERVAMYLQEKMLNPIVGAKENENVPYPFTTDFLLHGRRPSEIRNIVSEGENSVEIKQFHFVFKYEMEILGKIREVEVPFSVPANNYISAWKKATEYVKENFSNKLDCMTELSTIRFVNTHL